MSFRQIYNDSVRKLVLAFDIGTTFSGISYWYETLFVTSEAGCMHISTSFLDPGQLPSIKGVTK